MGDFLEEVPSEQNFEWEFARRNLNVIHSSFNSYSLRVASMPCSLLSTVDTRMKMDGYGSHSLCFRALCCKGPPPARPEYDLVCIGLTGSGKTSLLSKLCSESPDSVVSTTVLVISAPLNKSSQEDVDRN
ncbi:hypothetical protein J1605_013636 [Eschrichtius robustus]|uniref:Uncharacterized protein n=1 Tax=Eschrichtius robustus TaxID=9764 RepID=A0AB34GG82_ESCRO|nr:hypothetical protein J1605_013636 [Eschrichtius robustus]